MDDITSTFLRAPDLAWWGESLQLTVDHPWGHGRATYDFDSSREFGEVLALLTHRAIVVCGQDIQSMTDDSDHQGPGPLTPRAVAFARAEGFFLNPVAWLECLTKSMSAFPTPTTVLVTASSPMPLRSAQPTSKPGIDLTAAVKRVPAVLRRRRSAPMDAFVGGDDLSTSDVRHLHELVAVVYGFTRPGRKVVASAGALFPLRLDVLVRSGQQAILSSFDDENLSMADGRVADAAYTSALFPGVAMPPAAIVIVFDVASGAPTYGARSLWYALIEAGIVAETVQALAETFSLETRLFGGIDDRGPADGGRVALLSVLIRGRRDQT